MTRLPNWPLHLTAARWRIGANLNGCSWAAAGERMVWTPPGEVSVTI